MLTPSAALRAPPAQAQAAVTIQRRYRRKFLSYKSMQERMIDFKYSMTKRFIEHWIASNLEGQVTADPWMNQGAQDGMIKLLRDLNAELLNRSKHETLEERDAELRETMHDHVQPENWPLPPSKLNPIRWLRARLLYAVLPADKNQTYQIEVEPWMIGVNLLLVLPGGIVLWFILGLCILPVDDEYQLFNFIAMFKVYALVFWGLLPVWLDWFSFYLAFTSGTDEASYTACSSGGPSTDLFSLLLDRMFATVWVLCWVVFARFKWVRRLHARGQKPPVYTGDEDTGDREVTLAIKYDVAATALVVLGGTADLTYRILRRKTALAYFDVLWENILTNHGALMVHEVQHMSHGAKLFSSFLTLGLGFAALPWALFKSPIGTMLHQMRPTAYDASGAIRLQLDLPRMKKLEDRRRKEAAHHELKKDYHAKRISPAARIHVSVGRSP